MLDIHGREINYVRISVTQNCNLKCVYCNPGEKDNNCLSVISPKQYGLIVRCMANMGINRVRITGGEPLVRPDICSIISEIAQINRVEDISITTNGILLGAMAKELKECGLKRVNISLDSFKKDRFKQITGSDRLDAVISGISKAVEAGLNPVKINTVLVKGINDDEIDDFITLAKEMPVDVRFIELMPIGDFGAANSENIVYNDRLIEERPYLVKVQKDYSGQPAVYFKVPGYKGRVGFISPMGHKFCSICNRVRLTCDGKIKPCLGSNGEVDIMEAINQPEKLAEIIKSAVYNKPRGHNFDSGFNSNRNMSAIGG